MMKEMRALFALVLAALVLCGCVSTGRQVQSAALPGAPNVAAGGAALPGAGGTGAPVEGGAGASGTLKLDAAALRAVQQDGQNRSNRLTKAVPGGLVAAECHRLLYIGAEGEVRVLLEQRFEPACFDVYGDTLYFVRPNYDADKKLTGITLCRMPVAGGAAEELFAYGYSSNVYVFGEVLCVYHFIINPENGQDESEALFYKLDGTSAPPTELLPWKVSDVLQRMARLAFDPGHGQHVQLGEADWAEGLYTAQGVYRLYGTVDNTAFATWQEEDGTETEIANWEQLAANGRGYRTFSLLNADDGWLYLRGYPHYDLPEDQTTHILRVAKDGSGAQYIAEFDYHTCNTLDVVGGTLYFWDEDGNLLRCPATGGEVQRVLQEE